MGDNVNKAKTGARKKRWFLRIIQLLIACVIIYFIGRFILKNITQLQDYTFHINYLLLSCSLIICIIYQFNLSLIWYYITVKNKCNIKFSLTILYRIYAGFGKYIPGKIFGYAMMFYYYSKANQSVKATGSCLFIELVTALLSAIFIIIFCSLFIEIPLFVEYRFIGFILLALFFILIHPRILEFLSNIALKIIKRDPVKFEITYFQVLSIVGLYILNRLIFGVSFLFFINSIYPISFQYFFFITGATALAGTIGFFAIFVPAGLGVREGVLTLVLKNIMPDSFAGIISLASRLWQTVGEIILLLATFLLYRAMKINVNDHIRN